MQRSIIATATAVITLGAFGLIPNPVDARTTGLTQRASQNVTTIAMAPTASQSGQFIGADHPTQGNARIITENGQRYLEFDAAFRSDSGPDLFVLLHRSGRPTRYEKSDFVRLGRLQSTSGKQRYAIPADVNVNEFKSAVIWCRAFNVTFGFAPLV